MERVSVFRMRDFDEHERVLFVRDAASGLKAIIAIHNTRLGPALGGCRMYPYKSESAAITDALRLSRGMSYKASIAGVALGGGKSVIIGDPSRDKTEALLLAFGRTIAGLGGAYIVGEDIGTNPNDMKLIRRETRAVSCLRQEDGGYGDPAPLTALGVMQAMRAALVVTRNNPELRGVSVAVQGAGNVGTHLCRLLIAEGAEVTVCDRDETAANQAKSLGARVVRTQQIYSAKADIFAPCAIGATLNDASIGQLKAAIVAGAANNQLAAPRHADELARRGILYVPDYVANGGGLISCAAEWYRTDPGEVRARVLGIYDSCLAIFLGASRDGVTPNVAADRLARARLCAEAA